MRALLILVGVLEVVGRAGIIWSWVFVILSGFVGAWEVFPACLLALFVSGGVVVFAVHCEEGLKTLGEEP